MSERAQYFGPDGPFAEACDTYRARYDLPLPKDVLEAADDRGEGRLAWLLGYCFARALRRRAMAITENDLLAIATGKISQTNPIFFVHGFQFHERSETERTARA